MALSQEEALARFRQLEQQAQASFERGDFEKAAENLRNAVCFAPANARAYHGLGLAEAAAGHFDRAYEALQQANRLAPREFAILLSRAQVETSLGRFAQAHRTLVEAAQIEPENTLAGLLEVQILLAEHQTSGALAKAGELSRKFSTRTEVHARLGALLFQANLPKQAEHELELAQKLQPDNPQYLSDLVQVSVSGGDLSRAKSRLQQIAARGLPQSGQIHAQLGEQLFQQKQFDLALAELLRFKQSGLEQPESLFLLARVENAVGAYEDAVQDAARVENDAGLPERLRAAAATVAGLACKSIKQDDDAVRHLKLAIQLAPADLGTTIESAYLALAETYTEEQNPVEARKVLEQGTKALPDSTKIAVALGRNLAETGGNTAAIALLKELIRNAPGEAEAYRWLAQAYTSSGEVRLATEALEQLAQRQPEYPMADVMIAQSLLKEEPVDYTKALNRLERAEKSSPADPDIYYLRGKIYSSMGRYRDAVTALQRAIELGPAIPNSYYVLGLAYQKLGQTALAKEQFERMAHVRGGTPAP